MVSGQYQSLEGIVIRSYLGLLELEAVKIMTRRWSFLNDDERPVGTDFNAIAILQQVTRGYPWPYPDQVTIDVRSVGRLSITDVDIVDGWLVRDDINFTVVSRDGIVWVVVDCESARMVSNS